MHFLVVLVCSCLGVVDEMLTKDLHVTFLTFVKWPSPFGGQGRRPPFTRQHFANSCTFQSPPYAHLQSIPPIMGYYFTTRFTFTLQTSRISFSLMRDRRPCWCVDNFVPFYKEQSAMVFQLVLVRLEFCSKAARVCGQKVDTQLDCAVQL
jgi:hypothetical protein